MSLEEIGKAGSRLVTLQALRDRLAGAIDAAESPWELAQLSSRLEAVLQQIEACEKAAPEQKGTALDEFTKRRAERETKGSAVPAKRTQRGR